MYLMNIVSHHVLDTFTQLQIHNTYTALHKTNNN